MEEEEEKEEEKEEKEKEEKEEKEEEVLEILSRRRKSQSVSGCVLLGVCVCVSVYFVYVFATILCV